MESSHDNARNEGHKHDCRGGEVRAEEARPSICIVCRQVVILVGVERDEDVEGNESDIHEEGKEVVAAAAVWCSSFGRSEQMINGVHGDDQVPGNLIYIR